MFTGEVGVLEATVERARTSLLDLGRRERVDGIESALAVLGEAFGVRLAAIERELHALVEGGDLAAAAARHLVRAGGKRVRPLLCLLAAHAAGDGPGPATAVAAMAAEAVHGATLLHDDVIDLGERRRGVAAARVVFGNAASVLGGDLLLVRALERIEHTAPALLVPLLAVIGEMIEAEALQLAHRGRVWVEETDYLRIVQGKTASLFGWAARAGAWTARGCDGAERERLAHACARFGRELGVAYQQLDDLLDLVGSGERLGKSLLSDVREGKATPALRPALALDPELETLLAEAGREATLPEGLGARVRAAVIASGAPEQVRARVRAHTAAAIEAIETLPDTPGRRGLVELAAALLERES
ncbi:MAG: polyprenyl synthetase family protein [Planctomycetota bacterium]|nr:MAG: polyprenyl synthetase family protein [Planctomycetota bacterium]